MKKLIAVSSLLALVAAGSGLFAFDIPNSEGEKSGFSLDFQAEYEFDVITDDSKDHDNDKTWIEELDADKQGKVSIGVSYEGDNYAFGVGAGFRQKRATDDVADAGAGGDKEWYLDDAWGKYYLLDKQFSIRGGGLAGDWGGTIWDTFEGSWSDDNPGVQLAIAPSAVTGLTVGLSLPVPKAGTRKISETGEGWTISEDDTIIHLPASTDYGNWGPTYPLMNAVFGLRLNQTIPGLDFSTELKLNGMQANNGKASTEADEGEGDFQGADLHVIGIYTFAPVTVQFSLPVTGIANTVKNTTVDKVLDPLTKLAVRATFDIPNGEGSSLDLGDPWIQLKMLPNEFVRVGGVLAPVRNADGDLILPGEEESFKDMLIEFEWEPGYSLVPDQIKAYLWLGVNYRAWTNVEGDDLQKKYPLEVAVRPRLEFKFAPNATLNIQDKVFFVRKAIENGFRNELGFRFAFAF
jgi:hypothetical protein